MTLYDPIDYYHLRAPDKTNQEESECEKTQAKRRL